MADKWFPSPVLGYLGEQAMLDGIPFGSASRVVSDGDGDAKRVAQLVLEFCFPGLGAAIVAAARVGKNEEFGRGAMETSPLMFHQVTMEWAAKAAVSWETPTQTVPRLFGGS